MKPDKGNYQKIFLFILQNRNKLAQDRKRKKNNIKIILFVLERKFILYEILRNNECFFSVFFILMDYSMMILKCFLIYFVNKKYRKMNYIFSFFL